MLAFVAQRSVAQWTATLRWLLAGKKLRYKIFKILLAQKKLRYLLVGKKLRYRFFKILLAQEKLR